MPANPRSLQLTDRYRSRLEAIRSRVDRATQAAWRVSLEDLDATYAPWLDTAVRAVTTAQTQAIRATSGYLTAYVTLELGRRPSSPLTIASSEWAGKSRDSRPLGEALLSPLIGIKTLIGDGVDPAQALREGRRRAFMAVGLDTDQAARLALLTAIEQDDRFEGWTRSPAGTCGACLGVSNGSVNTGLMFEVHPNCNCVSAPVLSGVPATVSYPTGTEIIAATDDDELERELGPKAAQALRTGRITAADLVARSPLENEPDFITQAAVPAE